MTQSTEPTRSRRAKVEENLVFKPRRKNNSVGHLSNVSVSGAFFVSTEKITIGSEIILYLPVKMVAKKSLCIVSGKIVRIEKRGDLFGYGVCFREALTTNQRDMLQNFVEYKLTGKMAEKTDPEAAAPRIKLKKRPRSASTPSKKAPKDRRKHSRIVRDQRLQRTRTARLQLEKQETWTAREALENANKIMVSFAVAIVLLVGGAIFGWKTVQSMSIHSAVEDVLPLSESRISEGTYYGTLEEVWVSTTNQREKAFIFSEVAEKLEEKGMEGAVFLDEHKLPIAKLVKNNATKKLEVRLNL